MTRALERQLDRIEMALDAHGGGGREWVTPERVLRMQQILLAYLSNFYRGEALADLQVDLEQQFPSTGYWTRSPSETDAEASDAMMVRLLADQRAIGRVLPQLELGRVDYEEIDE